MEERKHYVYGLYKKNVEYKTNRIDEHLFYIGITSAINKDPLEKRAKDHRKDRINNKIKFNIINKYDFEIKTLYVCNSREEAEEREEFLIRWFGKIMNGGQLANVLDSVKDQVYKHLSKEDQEKVIKNMASKERTEEEKIRARDKNLTVPYDQVIEYIEEWVKNPLETHVDFCKRKNLSLSKFSDWIMLYKPEYLGLAIKLKKEILENVVLTYENYEDAITFIQSKFNVTRSSAMRSYRLTKNELYSIEVKHPKNYTEEMILNHIDSWIKSGLSQNKYTEQNNITKKIFKKWLKKYKPTHISSHSEVHRVKQVYDYINSGLSREEFCSNRFKPESLRKWTKEYQNKPFTNETNIPIITTPYDWVWTSGLNK